MQNRPRYTALTNAAGLLAPTVALTSPTPTSVLVTITPAVDTTATSYIVRYSSSNGTFADPLDYTIIERTGTFTLSGLTIDTTYYFQVSAKNSVGNTAFSATQSITTAIVCEAEDNEDGRLSASWNSVGLTDAVNDTLHIEKSANGTTGWTTVGTPAYNATSGFATINNPAISHYYRLKAYRYAGNQTFYSNVVGPLTITGDTDGAAFDARLVLTGRTPTAGEKLANARAGKSLRDKGLKAAGVDVNLLGWGSKDPDLLWFYSGSATDDGTGNVFNVAGKVTTGPAGAILSGRVPAALGFGGYGFYKVNSSSNASKIDSAAVTSAGGLRVVANIVNYLGTYYACYGGPQTSQQVTGTGETAPGLYSLIRSSATAQEYSRTTSSGKTVINNTAISSEGPLPNEQVPLGCYRIDGSNALFAEGDYALQFYCPQYLNATQRDDLLDILINWLLDLEWIT